MLRSPAFAVFDQCYLFARLFRDSPPTRLWTSVKDELGAMCGLCFLLRADLGAQGFPKAYMCDSSPTGYAVIRTEASVEELRSEAGLGVYGGWSVGLDREVDMKMSNVEDAPCLDDLPPIRLSGNLCSTG